MSQNYKSDENSQLIIKLNNKLYNFLRFVSFYILFQSQNAKLTRFSSKNLIPNIISSFLSFNNRHDTIYGWFCDLSLSQCIAEHIAEQTVWNKHMYLHEHPHMCITTRYTE